MNSANPQDREAAAILHTVESVARLADLRRWDALAALFAPTVVLDYGQPESLSPAQIIGRWAPLLGEFDATRHVLSDVAVRELDAGRARVASRFVATHELRGADAGGDVWTLSGRYEHALERTAGGWRITAMRMIPEQSGGNTALLGYAQERAAARSQAAR